MKQDNNINKDLLYNEDNKTNKYEELLQDDTMKEQHNKSKIEPNDDTLKEPIQFKDLIKEKELEEHKKDTKMFLSVENNEKLRPTSDIKSNSNISADVYVRKDKSEGNKLNKEESIRQSTTEYSEIQSIGVDDFNMRDYDLDDFDIKYVEVADNCKSEKN